MHRIVVFFAFLGALLSTAPGRLLAQSAAPPAAAEVAERVRLTVEREFGSRFKVVAKFPPMFGDFDGDGKEDLAVIVTGSPARDQAGHSYKLIDPYDSFFGYGDVRITMSFPIHAEGQALCGHRSRLARRAPQGEIRHREFALRAHRGQPRPVEEEARLGAFHHRSTGTQAEVFWDGKKYRWQAVGAE